jgi:hypothetical protein
MFFLGKQGRFVSSADEKIGVRNCERRGWEGAQLLSKLQHGKLVRARGSCAKTSFFHELEVTVMLAGTTMRVAVRRNQPTLIRDALTR